MISISVTANKEESVVLYAKRSSMDLSEEVVQLLNEATIKSNGLLAVDDILNLTNSGSYSKQFMPPYNFNLDAILKMNSHRICLYIPKPYNTYSGYIKFSDAPEYVLNTYAKSPSETEEQFVEFLIEKKLPFLYGEDAESDYAPLAGAYSGSNEDTLLMMSGRVLHEVRANLPPSALRGFVAKEVMDLMKNMGLMITNEISW